MAPDDAAAPPLRGGPQRIPRPPGTGPGAPAPWAHLPPEARRPRLADVRAALLAAGPAQPSPVEAGGFTSSWASQAGVPRQLAARPSAVLAALYDHDDEAWVLLTRRSSRMRAHGGEVSFPGGGFDEADGTLWATALREALEETGLDPSTVEHIGELDHLSTITSRSFIVPYVGALPGRPAGLVASPTEVDAILHVPLSELLEPAHFREERWPIGAFAPTTTPADDGVDGPAPDIMRPIVFFDLVGDTVWGATASMLRQLLGLVTGTLGRGQLDHD
jgi:8-oxo-dGTP pyrophosphatase MutT (NUDIX family)